MPFSPLFMKDVIFTVDGTDYQAELSSVLFEASSSQVEWKGLTPTSKFTESTPPSYTCKVKLAQDWDDAASFANFIYANNGQTVSATFQPKATGTASFAADLSIVDGPIGGDVDAFAESEITFGSTRPVKTTTP
jgi:hypothetical protein